ncbi:MAG: hypothetical protein KZQ70_06200 [gamma proteobacterium symbiont of Lucinoma myriamae]|nr:hypothetical protein [gamma proteobacterium symbiont of Lucinoma myriamae]MCU7817572.1 hypothetical protein [gamma proteobacterium symbiont of Lucinoma myriamae]MCU7832134.1 hypothetical protein [gamma proteobacterium symbiont of Lucinoma myriamae]
MPLIDRRKFIQLVGTDTAASAIPAILPLSTANAEKTKSIPKYFYDLPMKGNVRIVHSRP